MKEKCIFGLGILAKDVYNENIYAIKPCRFASLWVSWLVFEDAIVVLRFQG